MSRLETMARFEEPDEKEPKVVAECEYCGAAIYTIPQHILKGTSHYCGLDCMKMDLDYEWIGGVW